MVAQMPGGRVQPINIEDEMRASYLEYAMSVIVSRALPDVRDGLKPVQRRILHAMDELGLRSTSAYKKSAKIVGEVMGKYHPHGDAPIYDALVRMAQDFSLRYPLVDGQGNFGCFTGDTKIKLLDGTERSFAELADLPPGETFYVYSVNANGRFVVGEGHSSRIVRGAAQVIELTFDNGSTVRCTPDHRFMLRDGTWKEAQHLTIDDSLMAGYFDTAPINSRTADYLRIRQPMTGQYEFVHWLADAYNDRHRHTHVVDGPVVRHHTNFNRFDNRPDNIQRLSWLEHFHLHAEQLDALWQCDDFRAIQRKGVQDYYAAHPEAVASRRRRMVARNQDPAFRAANGPRVAQALRERHLRDPQPARLRGNHLRQLWSDPDYRARMSAALRGIEKRSLTPQQREEVARIISEKSRTMWQDEAMHRTIVDAIVAAMSDPGLRARLRENSRRLWQDPAYRAKYAPGHHSRMAQALWSNPATRQIHRAKLLRQHEDPAFLAANIASLKRTNQRRIAANPRMMNQLAANAAASLREKWADVAYQRRVMRSKIIGYVSRLMAGYGRDAISPDLYDAHRTANWIPRSAKLLRYFDSFDELVQEAATHNHRVVSIRWLDETVDVYDITVNEHHNFMLANGCVVHNSVDGDPPAAQRYTEARLAAIADEMLADIDKNTVDFYDNYDGSEQQPVVLPSRLPNLLVNGSAGIAVGMATNIPPHNLGEICDAITRLIDKPDTPTEELTKIVKGPDFPTAGIIVGREGIKQAFATGQGRIVTRARVQIEEMARGGRFQIVVSELPFQVNKAELIKKIAELVKDKRIDGISELRDESDRTGMRIVIELSRGGQAKQVLNALYKHTAMQTTFGVHMLCLVGGQPKTVNLQTALKQFIGFRREVVRRRTEFDLAKAKERHHILEGLLRAIDKLDAIIRLIRGAPSAAAAKEGLMARPFTFSDRQAQAILDMQLRRLAALERQQLQDEFDALVKKIKELEDILANPARVDALIKAETADLKKKHADERRTQIIDQELENFSEEDLIPHEDAVITLSNRGYIKRVPLETYRRQRRGGRGVTGMVTREEDAVRRLVVADTHDLLLFFTDRGRVFPLKVFEVPDATRTAKGIPLINMVDIAQGELVTAIIATNSYEKDCLVLSTKLGEVKRTPLSEFAAVRRNGLIAMNLEDGDELISARMARSTDDLIIVTAKGQAARFHVKDLRMASRTSGGVRGVRLTKGDTVVAMEIVEPKGELLTLSEHGFGKRTPLEQYPVKGRGGQGVAGFKVTGKTGSVAAARVVDATRELMLISQDGIVLRTSVESIRRSGRSTEGVSVMKVAPGDRIASIAVIDASSAAPAPDGTDGREGAKPSAARPARAADGAAPARARTPAPRPGANGHKPPFGSNGKGKGK